MREELGTHFISEKTEDYKEDRICPRSHNWASEVLGFEFRCDSEAWSPPAPPHPVLDLQRAAESTRMQCEKENHLTVAFWWLL